MAQAVAKSAPLPKEKVFLEIDGEKVEEGSNEHLILSENFEAGKKYMFELAVENSEREQPVIDMRTGRPTPKKKYKPYQNIVLTSQIVWKGQRRMLRYYDGCDSIFQDKQPKDKETIDQLIAQTPRERYKFLEGKFGCFGDERQLLLYLFICSWNGESPFKTKSSDTIFVPSDVQKRATAESLKIDQIEEALKFAREASETKMRIHANYLGIPDIDHDSGNELTEKEIRTEYRREASRNPSSFIESFGNRSIEIKYYIDKALEKGIINNKFNPNKATWGSNNSVICDISGLKSHDAIAQKLFEFSQSEEGEEFVIQLKAINE